MESIVPVVPQSSAHKDIPLEDILALQSRNPNMTQDEIATILGCSRKNIGQRLAKHGAKTKSLERFQTYEGKVIASIRQKMMTELAARSPDDLKSVSVRDLSITYGVLYDKGRLQDGKSTANVSLAEAAMSLSNSLEQIDKELEGMGVGEGG